MLDRYMAQQARVGTLTKTVFKEAAARHSEHSNRGEYDGACACPLNRAPSVSSLAPPTDIIAAIHANVPMDSVAAAMRDAMMPKFPQFFAVISGIIPSLSEARIMQVVVHAAAAAAAIVVVAVGSCCCCCCCC